MYPPPEVPAVSDFEQLFRLLDLVEADQREPRMMCDIESALWGRGHDGADQDGIEQIRN